MYTLVFMRKGEIKDQYLHSQLGDQGLGRALWNSSYVALARGRISHISMRAATPCIGFLEIVEVGRPGTKEREVYKTNIEGIKMTHAQSIEKEVNGGIAVIIKGRAINPTVIIEFYEEENETDINTEMYPE